MRVRRVGSVTCGCVLILFGGLFILRRLVPWITYDLIVHLWPLVLIFLGIEILISNLRAGEKVFKYDVGAAALVLVLALFALAMGVSEFCIEHAEPPYIYFGT